MKVLAINGSPNKHGSTSKLIDMILEFCIKAGADCEKIHLEDYVIGECTGCSKYSAGCECCKDDDFMQLKAKMLESDGIVIGSPYYSGRPTVQIKTFLDRLAFTSASHIAFSGKYIIGVSTSSVSNSRKVAKYCASLGHTSFMGNGIISGTLSESIVDKVVLGELADNAELKEKACIVGQKMIDDINKKREAPFHTVKKIFLRKWIRIFIIRVLRAADKLTVSIRRFMTDRGWIKKINKIED